jgi:hypothetical protein
LVESCVKFVRTLNPSALSAAIIVWSLMLGTPVPLPMKEEAVMLEVTVT